jgi:hypothetical protein
LNIPSSSSLNAYDQTSENHLKCRYRASCQIRGTGLLAHLIHDLILGCGVCQKAFYQLTLALGALELHTRLFKKASFL